MNVYIMADMEGISGIYSQEQVLPNGSAQYQNACKLMMNDINVCAKACKQAGVSKVYVRDCHAAANNINWNDLSEYVDYCILGKIGTNRFAYIEECDAVILLGYHAMAGTENAILEHSMSSKSIQNYKINGSFAGEIAIDSAIAGEYNKPVIMVSGDDKACVEAKAILPNVITCEVKKSLSVCGGMLLPPKQAYELIEKRTKQSIENFENANIYTLEKPVKFTIELTERSALPNITGKNNIKVIDARTYEVTANNMLDALNMA